MANLLEDPNVWESYAAVSPPTEWNGAAYAFTSDSAATASVLLKCTGARESGDLFSGRCAFDNRDGISAYINQTSIADNAVVASVALPAGEETEFSFDATLGEQIVIATNANDQYGTNYYGLNVTITPDSAPGVVANNDESTTPAGVAVTTDVLANDTYNEGPATLENVTLPSITLAPENGTVEVNADGTITYTPNEGFVGQDSFVYEILRAEPQPPDVVDMCYVNGGEAGTYILLTPELDIDLPMTVVFSTHEEDDSMQLYSYSSGTELLLWYPGGWEHNTFGGGDCVIYQGDRKIHARMSEGAMLRTSSGGSWSFEPGYWDLVSLTLDDVVYTYDEIENEFTPDLRAAMDQGKECAVEMLVYGDGYITVCGSASWSPGE